MSRRVTIFGGNGFIGRELVRQLEGAGHDVTPVARGNWPAPGADLGEVIFTIGMTADFRARLVETVELQVVRLYEALTQYKFDSFLYLSSARVYAGAQDTSEDCALSVRPVDPDNIYNISKLMGESLCFSLASPKVRVVRLSNVFGRSDTSNLFLTAVIREGLATGRVTIGQSPLSAKDYVPVEQVAKSVIAISATGKSRLYNVASGINISHQEIADILHHQGIAVDFKQGGPVVSFPDISITRLRDEFGIAPRHPAEDIRLVVQNLSMESQRA